MSTLIPGDGLKRGQPAFAVVKVFIARGEHFSTPGEHFSVHATMAGANAAALKSLNMLRADLDMPPVTVFTARSINPVKEVLERRGDDPDECDVWIEEFEVKN